MSMRSTTYGAAICAGLLAVAAGTAGAQGTARSTEPQAGQGSTQAADPHAAHRRQAAATNSAAPLSLPLINASGASVGTARLTQLPHGVLVALDARSLPPGEHALHFHMIGSCDPATQFNSAGGHFAPGATSHGFGVQAGPHAGDMPNQFVAADGTLRAHVLNPAVTLGSGANSLFDTDGSALILHEKADDYSTQPTGDAGGRLACAVIKKPA
jgi:Cu-Zn family superoxide dismutase